MMIRHTITAILALLLSLPAAAVNVTLLTDEGQARPVSLSVAERNLSTLLTNINNAQASGSAVITMNNVQMDDFSKKSLARLWDVSQFRVDDDEVVERVWIFAKGDMMVSHIPLIVTPTNEQEFGSGMYQEAVAEFDASGQITDFRLALDAQMSESMEHCGEVADRERQMQILSYVERFRTAYCQHDIDFIAQMFSDDALIITGKVVTRKQGGDNPYMTQSVIYNKQTKEEYVSNLTRVFRFNKWIDVKFSQIGEGELGGCGGITRSKINPNIYGVRLVQEWHSRSTRGTEYSDTGYLFLLWDFKDEEHPQIHVRTWQPTVVAGKQVQPDKEISTLAGFDL